jgi:4-oxalocrotonate tautomerase
LTPHSDIAILQSLADPSPLRKGAPLDLPACKSNDFLIPSQSIPDPNPVSLHCGKKPNQKVEKKQSMPLIQVKLIEDVFTAAQKKEMITKLTDAMVAIEGENMRSVTWVIIEDVRSGEWGIGGQALTTQAVQAIAAGKS